MRPRKRIVAAGLAVAGLAVGLAACGSGGSSAASGGGTGGPDTIVIKNFAFGPSDLKVAAGATVTVKNNDDTTHTVTVDSGKAFDTGDVGAHQTKTFTAPNRAGAYPYHCAIHQYMHGTLTVTG